VLVLLFTGENVERARRATDFSKADAAHGKMAGIAGGLRDGRSKVTHAVFVRVYAPQTAAADIVLGAARLALTGRPFGRSSRPDGRLSRTFRSRTGSRSMRRWRGSWRKSVPAAMLYALTFTRSMGDACRRRERARLPLERRPPTARRRSADSRQYMAPTRSGQCVGRRVGGTIHRGTKNGSGTRCFCGLSPKCSPPP